MTKKTLKIKQSTSLVSNEIQYYVDARIHPIGFSKENVIKLLGGKSNVEIGYWVDPIHHYRDRYGKLKCRYEHTYTIKDIELAKKSIVEQNCNYVIEVI